MELDEIAAFVFLDIAVVVLVARLMGGLFQRIRQPAVVGEIVGGILLGPTLLGQLPGNLTENLFPPEVRPFLSVVAQLGLIIFMFIVGMELDLKLVKSHGRTAAVISLSSIIVPFTLGGVLAVAIYDNHKMVGGGTVDFTAFALFLGASMSITAFPVLARILSERGMLRTPIGTLALASAAVDDIVAWSILAVVVAVVEATGVWDLPRILMLSLAFVTIMFLVVRPQLTRLNDRYRAAGQLTPGMLSVVLVGVLLSSFITSKIGIHSIFGAFLFGTVMPRKQARDLLNDVLGHIEPVSVVLLLPVFFVATGLAVDVGGIGVAGIGELAIILFVACAGKLVGAAGAARAQGIPGRKAAAIGILMNTRGLTELVILNVGLSKGVLDSELFTMLVVMAVFTTIITEPLLRVTYSQHMLARDISSDARSRLSVTNPYRVLVGIGDSSGRALVDTAMSMVGDERFREIVLIQLFPSPPMGVPVHGEPPAGLESVGDVVRAEGIQCVVQSCVSGDPAYELVEQASTTQANVILLSASDSQVVEKVLGQAPCQVVVMAGANGTANTASIAAVVTGDRNAHATLEIAVRVASGRRIPLTVVSHDRRTSRRKLRHAVEVLGRDSITCSVVDVPGDETDELHRQLDGQAVVVVGSGAVSGSTVAPENVTSLQVQAADGDGAELSRLIERRERAQRSAARASRRSP